MLHITGRSDHGGGPEHLLHIATRSEPARTWIACPRSGIYWQRYAGIVGTSHLLALPHRRTSLRHLLRLRRLVRTQGIDVVHSHGTAGGIYGRALSALTAVPCVHSFHGLHVSGRAKRLVLRLLERLVARFTDRAIAVSEGEADLVRALYPGHRTHLVVIPNGIPAAKPGALAQAGTAEADPACRRLVTFTRLNRQKDPWLALDLVQILRSSGLPRFRLDLFGADLTSHAFRAEIVRRRLTDVVFPHEPVDTPERALADAFLYLSTSRWEGLPLALLEAQRAGVCIVASDVVGNRDVVIDGVTGVLFRAGDAGAGAQAVASLLREPERATALAGAGREHCLRHHDVGTMIQRLQQVYREARSHRQPRVSARPAWTVRR